MNIDDLKKKDSRHPDRYVRYIRRPMISGLLIVVPAGVTVFVLKLLYDFTAGRLAPYVRKYIDPFPDYISPVVACIFLFVLVYFIGMVASVVLGRKAIGIVEGLIQAIPLVKSIYSASKQVVESLTFKKRKTEPKVPVLIEFPCPGMKCIGFALGKAVFQDGREFYNVFVPTTPNITVGLLQLVAPQDVYKCDLSIDEAVKIVVSGGILGPDRMMLRRASQASLSQAGDDDEYDDDDWDDDDG